MMRRLYIGASLLLLGSGCSDRTPLVDVSSRFPNELPGYPSGSAACGVAVAAVRLAADGTSADVEVLDAPDLPTHDAMVAAMRAYRFTSAAPVTGSATDTSVSDQSPKRRERRVIVYFVNFSGVPGQGRVYSPNDAPNISTCRPHQGAS